MSRRKENEDSKRNKFFKKRLIVECQWVKAVSKDDMA